MHPHFAGFVTDAPVASGGSEAAPGGLSRAWWWCGVVLGSAGAQEARLGAACGRRHAWFMHTADMKKSHVTDVCTVDSVVETMTFRG